jgi:leader peptidase (prepilin peptidase)/N-methyltransferase
MPSINITLIGLLLFGMAAVLVIPPLARYIPLRLQQQWEVDLAAEALHRRDGLEKQHGSFSWMHKILLAGAGLALGALVLHVYGATPEAAARSCFFLAVLLLVAINTRHALLPDAVTLPTLWAGLIYHAATGAPAMYIHGAALAYMVPFVLVTLIRMVKGVEVMGKGDFKAFSMAGAWFGVGALPTIFAGFIAGVAVSMLIGAIWRRPAQGWVPTGPAHLFASIACALGLHVF